MSRCLRGGPLSARVESSTRFLAGGNRMSYPRSCVPCSALTWCSVNFITDPVLITQSV